VIPVDTVIRAQALSKKYFISQQGDRVGYATLRDTLTKTASDLFRNKFRTADQNQVDLADQVEEFWALKAVSFEIKRGEVVGIIGRNGAGKSTLLKVLSRITDPSEGRLEIRGRVASLLEVGTGFNPELTGRENIYLNGAILGMNRGEIRSKFDEIVAFAEVDRFLDTPVKRYSSGMYVRLAFAVAAHLEPEILVVDEVLAVGDSTFQKKCLGKIGQVASSGRTVLFVSHNMNAVEALCTRAMWLSHGELRGDSKDVRKIISAHLNEGVENRDYASAWVNNSDFLNHPVLNPISFALRDSQGCVITSPVRNDEPVELHVCVDVQQLDPSLNIGLALYNENSELILWSLSTDGREERWPRLTVGVVNLRCKLPTRFLNEGRFRIELLASLHFREWILQPGKNAPAISFEVRGGLSDSPYWLSARPGILAPDWEWEVSKN
jgi:lipopolysaccharide transport system ATP-binding protein